MKLGEAHIIQGNALNLPLPDASVDLVCTSPPYFGLRSYQDGGTHYDGQIGSEATPAEFLDALIAATAEMMRVLKPSGSIFVNLGDKYAGLANQRERRATQPVDGINSPTGRLTRRLETTPQAISFGNIRDKSLMGIPWRYAIRCIDQLGLILRAEIIWSKPNGLPESATDRVRRSHEQWFHLTRSPRYFSAVDEIREEHTGNAHARGPNARVQDWTSGNGVKHRTAHGNPEDFNPLGKLPGSVWTVPTQPLTVPPELGVDHFAAYPMEWPRRIIQGWTPNGICTACGEGRRPSTDRIAEQHATSVQAAIDRVASTAGAINGGTAMSTLRGVTQHTITGYTCNCPTPTAPTTPAVVLDPFGGTGTTALVAKALGRTGITIDLSADYCRLAQWRCNDPSQLAAALQVEKPEPVPPDQEALFT